MYYVALLALKEEEEGRGKSKETYCFRCVSKDILCDRYNWTETQYSMDKMGKGFEQLLGRKFRQAKSSIQAAWSAQPERESASNEVFECEKALRELNEWHERVIVPLNKTIKTLDEAVITSAGWALKISPVPESIKSRIESIKRAYATDTKSKVGVVPWRVCACSYRAGY